MNKKGFTLVELIVSFSLATVICIFLLQLILSLKTLYDNSGIKTEILNKQSLISNQINKTFNSKSISSLSSCGEACININYNDNTIDTLKIDYNTNTLQFGNFYTTLPENTYFKNASVDIIYSGVVDKDSNDALLNIIIPIENNKIKNEKFGLNIVYQFNSSQTNIEYVNFSSSENYIVLKGDTEQVFNSKTAYVEEGYTIYDKNGNVTTGTVEIDNPLTNLPYKTGNYKIKYSLKDSSGNIISQATRSVTITPSTYNITNLVTNGDLNTNYQNMNSSLTSGGYYEYASNGGIQNSGYLKIYPAGTFNYIYTSTTLTIPYNHMYYIRGSYRKNGGGDTAIAFHNVSLNITNTRCVTSNETEIWTNHSCYGTQSNQSNEEYNLLLYGAAYTYTSGMYTDWDNIMLVDLTETFGAGNEPSKEWCDENINWFDGTTTISY